MHVPFLFCLLISSAWAADILIAGDSWGTHANIPFKEMLQRKHSKLTYENIAISGTTSGNWARTPDKIRDNVKSDTKVVWVTLGGNDAKDKLPLCQLEGKSLETCIQKVITEFEANSAKYLEPVFNAHPNVRVVQFGYDILDMDKLPICPVLGLGLMPVCKDKASCFNHYFMALQNVTEALAAKYPRQDSINLLGSLQAYKKYPGVTPGHPDVARYSPGELLEDNCIHPTSTGFIPILDNFYDIYLHKYEPTN